MFKNYFKGIDGIASYPEISLIVFFLFFLALTLWVIRADKRVLDRIARMPLEEDKHHPFNDPNL